MDMQFEYCVKITRLLTILVVTLSCSFKQFSPTKNLNAHYNCLCSHHAYNTNQLSSTDFGFFSSKLWKDYSKSLEKEITNFGITPKYILWYIEIDKPFPTKTVTINNSLNIATVISHEIRSQTFSKSRNNNLLQEIVSGEWDLYFKKFAHHAQMCSTTIYYRFGYEMNGDWFPWGEKPQLFIAAWKHIHTLFKKQKAYNVKWVFSPSVLWGRRNAEDDLLAYYPGKQFVDIVGLDGYNFGDKHTLLHRWQSFTDVFESSLLALSTLQKPMWLCEVGCAVDTRRSQWLADFFNYLEANPCIEAFFWFNENKDNEPDFRIQADSTSLYVFRSRIRYLSGQKQTIQVSLE